MIEKIFNEYHDRQVKNTAMFAEYFGISDADHVTNILSKKTLDLLIILEEVVEIPDDVDGIKELNKFYNELCKCGIGVGASIVRQSLIDQILSEEISIIEIMEIDDGNNWGFEFFSPFDYFIEAFR